MPALYKDPSKDKVFVKMMESELLGIKHTIGHTSNLNKEDLLQRQFLTKSSSSLNKLCDKLKNRLRIPFVLNYLKKKSNSKEINNFKQNFFTEFCAKTPMVRLDAIKSPQETRRSMANFTVAYNNFQKNIDSSSEEEKFLDKHLKISLPNLKLKVLASTSDVENLDKSFINRQRKENWGKL